MHIAIIDDEQNLAKKISKKLRWAWYTVDEFYSYNEFMKYGFFDDIFDLYVIDISLWDGSWFEIIQNLKQSNKISHPIIVISWFWILETKLFWFDMWIDDFVTKPFCPEELIARIRSILRRPRNISQNTKIIYKWIVFEPLSGEIQFEWQNITLSKKEKNIIIFFIENIWKIISKENFIKVIWGHRIDREINNNTINATLSKLRKKLWNNFPLQTIPHIWYILE